jgi:hypothetical protein
MELFVALLILSPMVVLVARGFIPNGISFEDLLRRTDLDWPRGVQEEEPVRWHVERLQPRSATTATPSTAPRGRGPSGNGGR